MILKSNLPHCRALHRMVYRAEQQDNISNGVNFKEGELKWQRQ